MLNFEFLTPPPPKKIYCFSSSKAETQETELLFLVLFLDISNSGIDTRGEIFPWTQKMDLCNCSKPLHRFEAICNLQLCLVIPRQ